MFAWLLTLFCLLSVGRPSKVVEPPTEILLNADVLLITFLKLGLADLYRISYVSRSFRGPADQAIRVLYCSQSGEKVYPNYTLLLRELDGLVECEGGNLGTVAEASTAPKAGLPLMCIQSMLEARFGYCIKYDGEGMPTFCLREVCLDILNDEKKVSVLPYILDQNSEHPQWIRFIYGLIELGRFDLLDQLTFPKIDTDGMHELASASVPDSVLVAASKSLQKNEPALHLAGLFALAESGNQNATLPENEAAPLFLLPYLCERNISIPKSCTFILGLDPSSLRFWMYILQDRVGKAQGMVSLVLEQGDTKAKYLVSVFSELVSVTGAQCYEMDVYQAMLIRFRFSSICNGYVVQNYEQMRERPLTIGYHTTWALLDCEQYELAQWYSSTYIYAADFEPFIGKMYRLKNGDLEAFIPRCFQNYWDAPNLLKHLIQRRAEPAYIWFIWEAIIGQLTRATGWQCCSVSLATLQRLAYEQDISVPNVQEILCMLAGFQDRDGNEISREVHVLYMVMFWEAPEEVIDHFLDLVPHDLKLDDELIWGLLLVTKYSVGFCGKLAARLQETEDQIELRPDLFASDKQSTRVPTWPVCKR